jgi:hypothetical protein
MRILRFASLMSTAVSMTAAVAHLLEMPSKMRYERELYVRLHRTLYRNFGRFAGVAEILSVVLAAGLALRRGRQKGDRRDMTAAACLATSHAIFWALVSPANQTMASWPLTALPKRWQQWRDQWEYAHAIRAVLQLAAMGALLSSALAETPSSVSDRDYPAPAVPARAATETPTYTA